jgi:hypothetical protein
MTDLRAAAQQALEALEQAHPEPYDTDIRAHVEAITALRAALARQAALVTLEDLYQMLVNVELVYQDAIDDPDGYDGGITLTQINELYAQLTESQR